MPDEAGQSSGLGAITTQPPGPESYISPVGAPGGPPGGATLATPAAGDKHALGTASPISPAAPAATSAAAIPTALLCAPNQCWHWTHSTGVDITDYYTYMLRFALWAQAPGTCQLVWVIDQVYVNPLLGYPNTCQLLNTWISNGTVTVPGSQIIFVTRGLRRQTDACEPSKDAQWPIGGQTIFQWALDPTHTKLFITLPFAFGGFNKIICTKINF
jgi:hypothetical protein